MQAIVDSSDQGSRLLVASIRDANEIAELAVQVPRGPGRGAGRACRGVTCAARTLPTCTARQLPPPCNPPPQGCNTFTISPAGAQQLVSEPLTVAAAELFQEHADEMGGMRTH
jgi:hypothetical protein